jgi:cytochrome oxidase assembly protein ShyY1
MWSIRPVPTVAMVVVVVATVRLGFWQVSRFFESQAKSVAITAAWERSEVTELPALDDGLNNRRASLTGRVLEEIPALSAGGLVGGLPGYRYVLPFELKGGSTMLVDLGWVPVHADRAQLHGMRPEGVVTLVGLLAIAEGVRSLQPDVVAGMERWPLSGDLLLGVFPRVHGPPYGAIAAARSVDRGLVLRVGEPTEEERLHPGEIPITGYTLPLPKVHHRSYAAQWFAIALGTLLLWAWYSWRPSAVKP